MRAAVITEPGGPDVLKIMEVDDPAPGPEDILVDVKATAASKKSSAGIGCESSHAARST